MSRIARRVHQAGVYFVTTDTWERRPIFAKSKTAHIVIEQLLDCRERGFYKLHAFVIMPDHIHILITPGDSIAVEKAVQMIKGGSSHRIGLDDPHRFPIWHTGFHDRWIRDVEEYRNTKLYIEQNPISSGLNQSPGQHLFSSASGSYPLDLSKFDRG
jgi:putative transposase